MIWTSSQTPAPSVLRRHGLRVVAAAVAAAVTLAACGDDDDGDADPVGSTTEPAATSPTTVADDPASTSDGSAAAGDDAIGLIETDIGSVLGDGAGMTLYVFMPDAQGPSTCVDACLDNWPAKIAPVTAGDGVDETLLGTATRPDGGGDQVTYNDWPLYYFAADIGPGDMSGQGVGDVWFVVDAAGDPVPAD